MMTENRKKIELETKDLVLTNDQLQKVSTLLLQEFIKGLSLAQHETASLKMLPTFVRDVPNGTERGKFLALDLGGTNFRVLMIDLDGEQFTMENEIYEIPESIMLGSGEQLFNHIADCLAQFLEDKNLKDRKLPLGFTFSFPCKQNGLTSASLVEWTKGFKCDGVVGQDVVQLLRQAVLRIGGVDIDVVAVLNDTTGTLMSCAHKNKTCRLGLIVGTGTNACYMERMENIETWTGDRNEPHQVIVNTEWGAFGDDRCLDFIRTKFDHEVDINSLNPGKQLFEKMVSGMYMGEIVRQVLIKCVEKGFMLNGKLTEKLKTPYAFKSKYVSNVETDPKQKYVETRVVFQKMGILDASEDDCENLKLICSRVSTRAAHLVSSAVATILNKMKREHTTVGVDGSVYRYHPYFKELMEKKIDELTIPDFKFDLMLSEDGSGRGAALVAAVAVRPKK